MDDKGAFNSKLSRRVFIYIFLCSAFLSVCSTLLHLYGDFKDGLTALDKRFDNIELSFNQSISTSLWDFNEALVEQQISGILRLPDIRHVKITTSFGKVYQVGNAQLDAKKIKTYAIAFQGNSIGEMVISADYQDIYQQLWQKAGFIIVSEFIKIFIVALSTFFIVHWMITRHLFRITLYSKALSGENLDTQLSLENRTKQPDELDELVAAINAMRLTLKNDIIKLEDAENALIDLNGDLEIKVYERTAKLAESNQQLQQSLDKLTLAKDQLVQSEKMASLGQLVAGVAHEVNTPLGICITSASALKEKLAELEQALTEQTLTKKQLSAALQLFSEYEQIIERSLTKAVDLIRGFKSVAVEYHTDPKLNINLAQHVKDIVNTVKTLFKQKNYRIEIQVDEELHLVTYPSAWNQILTNLLTNSHIHGFEGKIDGDITIAFQRNEDNLILTYQDNGKGLAADIKDKIFEPFVTTKRGVGGSGLGMNIVYNLVSTKLAGSIEVKDKTPGCCFVITVPIEKAQPPAETNISELKVNP
ncbi:HAMP domain-containing protein [Colwellia chukchiensis]|uniref:histidine kinase n=1 Tax=Colwellia chukchiensis TaxID=641665 RepID=A0A1H7J8I0_9GAMM|nr:ATP-binding protein [Colwellia chukchiensis]SEK70906.1 HAMP domain-containing protein [Colwellia chukchiensis]